MHGQSLAVHLEKGDAVTRRQQSVDDLLKQLNHFNKTTRKEALFGLKELAVRHQHALQLQLAAVLGKVRAAPLCNIWLIFVVNFLGL